MFTTPTRTFANNAALSAFRRVVFSAGVLAYAGASEAGIGVMDRHSFATDPSATVRLFTAEGTTKMVAAGAITVNADVFAAADGKVSATGTVKLGKALEAAGADGDIIEVLPLVIGDGSSGVATVASAGSTQSDAAPLSVGINTVTGADGTKGVILPAAAPGLRVSVYNAVATNGLKIYPATGDDINGGSANAAITIEGKTHAIFEAVDATTWAAIYTVNS